MIQLAGRARARVAIRVRRILARIGGRRSKAKGIGGGGRLRLRLLRRLRKAISGSGNP